MEEMNLKTKNGEKMNIPINTRIIGMPGGAVVLYLEDYVHTFIKKLVEQDITQTWTVDLYGIIIEDAQSENFLVQGAVETGMCKLPISGERYFPESCFIGSAQIAQSFSGEISILLQPQKGNKIKLDSFYIYYDQNEEMQNYLIEWNLQHRKLPLKREKDETVRYGRVLQAQNKEEVKVSILWNAMNILCMGFVVCIMVYAVTMINSYKKMEEMKETINYIADAMSNQQGLTIIDKIENRKAALETMQQLQQETSPQTEEMKPDETISQVIQTQPEEIQSEEIMQSQEIQLQETYLQTENSVITDGQKNIIQPQTYYIVQKGDTLRSISFQIYGNYDYVEAICVQNGLSNPDSILCGQKLLLP